MSVVLNQRAVDYRKAAMHLCIHLQGKINVDVYDILLTICYMQEILYGAEDDRNMSRIFRYHMLCYVHTDLLVDFLGKKLKAIPFQGILVNNLELCQVKALMQNSRRDISIQ